MDFGDLRSDPSDSGPNRSPEPAPAAPLISRVSIADLRSYASLEAETGLSTGFKGVGFIEVAADRDRLEEYRRVSAFNRHCGVDVHEISPSQVKELFPLAKTVPFSNMPRSQGSSAIAG